MYERYEGGMETGLNRGEGERRGEKRRGEKRRGILVVCI